MSIQDCKNQEIEHITYIKNTNYLTQCNSKYKSHSIKIATCIVLVEKKVFSTVPFTLKHMAFQLSKCINHVNMLLQLVFEGRLGNSFLRLHILRCCHTFKIMNSNDPFSIVYLLGNCVGNYLLRIQRKPNLINNE